MNEIARKTETVATGSVASGATLGTEVPGTDALIALAAETGATGRLPLRRIARLATFLALATMLTGVSLAAATFIANGGSIPLAHHLYFFLPIPVIFGIFGLLILNRHPKHTVGWLIMLVGFMAGLHILNHGYQVFDALALTGNANTALHLSIQLGHILWWPVLVLPFTLIILYFPDGRLPSPRWRIAVIATVLGLITGVTTAFHPGPVPEWGVMEPNPLGIRGSERLLGALAPVYTGLFLIGGFGSLAAVTIRFRRSSGVERVQMKWLVYSALMAVTFLSILVVIGLISANSDPAFVRLTYILPILLIFIVPVTCGIAILRHRLWDIDIIINRTLVYAGLTVLVAGIYVIVVGGLGAQLRIQNDTLAGLAAAGIVAVLFQPLRDWLQRGVNRLLYGERDDPAAVLTRLTHHLETADTPAAILPNLVHTIARALKIPYVAIRLPVTDDQFEPVAFWGEEPLHVELLPLTYQKETIGHLIVAPRGPRETFNRDEWQLLSTIAGLTANTVRAVQLSDELRQSRRRIVTAREEERRRLRRDLHDGLGPQLASQTLGLDAVEQLLPTDPDKAHQLLASLKAQAQEAISDVRRLVYDLRPPALDDLGLVGALQQSALRYENERLRFTFDVPEPLPELPAAVETAAYRISQEAMTNVMRHARATGGTVRLTCVDEYLMVEIRDDGQGLPPEYQSGIGLQSMRERAAELNGRCDIESPPEGGTLVRVRLPLEANDE